VDKNVDSDANLLKFKGFFMAVQKADRLKKSKLQGLMN